MSKYYQPKQKKEILCRRCEISFFGLESQKFCSFKCKNSFNEKKIRERLFVKKHYDKIVNILSKTCKCGSLADEIHHKTYNIPIRKINLDNRKKYNSATEKDLYEMLVKYCKFLEHLCFSCHKKQLT